MSSRSSLAGILCALCLWPGCRKDDRPLPFLWGIVFTPGANDRPIEGQIKDMSEAGANAAKFWFEWSRVENTALTYDSALRPTERGSFLTRSLVRSNPGLVKEYAHPERGRFEGRLDWAYYDSLIEALNRAGLAPVPLIGDATTAPQARETQADGLKIAPEPAEWMSTEPTPQSPGYWGIGREEYLGHLMLFVAAAARRYSSGNRTVTLWNTENELNWTYVHVLVAGWRKGDAWLDETFLTELLATLQEAVHFGNPAARSTMNLNISDPKWLAALRRFAPDMDVIGLGAYPNYLFGEPILSGQIADAIASAITLGKPVMVLETGYPSGPPGQGWSPENQAEYFRAASRGVCQSGATGFFYFKLDDESHPRDAIQQVENHWGLVDVTGERKSSFSAFREAANAGCPFLP